MLKLLFVVGICVATSFLLPWPVALIINLLLVVFLFWDWKYNLFYDSDLKTYTPVCCREKIFVGRKISDKINLRYVYTNGAESIHYNPLIGKVYGYRITDSLVLHETICCGNFSLQDARYMRDKCEARFLTLSEFLLVVKVWKQLSWMRFMASDCPLPTGYYWVELAESGQENKESATDCTLIHFKTLKTYPYCEFDDTGNCLFAI